MKTLKFWGQEVNVVGNLWITQIHKPLFGTTGALNGKLLREAQKAGVMLKVICGGETEIISPEDWVKNATRFEKSFRDPEHPMVLYQKKVGKDQEKKEPDKTMQENQMKIF